MTDLFKSKSSKSRKKESKYIPAAIIPSVAFVANPTQPISQHIIDEKSNKLLNSPLSSSLVGLNSEFRRHQIEETNDADETIDTKRPRSLDRQFNENDNNQHTSPDKQELKRSKRQDKNDKSDSGSDSRRHINIANGLFENNSPITPSRRNKNPVEIQEQRDISNGSVYTLDQNEDNGSFKNVHFQNPNNNLGFKNIENTRISDSDKDVSYVANMDGTLNMVLNNLDAVDDTYATIPMDRVTDNDRQLPPHSTETLYPAPKNFKDTTIDPGYSMSSRNTRNKTLNNEGFEEKGISHGFEDKYNKSLHTLDAVDGAYESYEAHRKTANSTQLPLHSTEKLYPAPKNFKDTTIVNGDEAHNHVYSMSSRSKRNKTHTNEGDDRNIRQLKDEIHILQDINYKLNIEIADLLPEQENGRYIGKSVFPGKGPVPHWIMNTKYLAPLLAAYDRKFQLQNFNIKKLKGSIAQFEKEIRQVLSENKQLYLQLQENKKSGPANQSEWLIIIDQTKLVIEENQLLLQELDVQQQRNKEQEKKYIMDVAQLRTYLSNVTSERDLSNKEVAILTSKISEMKEGINNMYSNNAASPEMNSLKNQIDDLLRNKKSLESEINELSDKERKSEKKIEKLKATLKTEKEFRQYLSDVIDKGNDIANERDTLAELMGHRDTEIKRITNKLVNDIKYNLDIGMSVSSAEICTRKTDDVALEQLYNLETWISMLVQSAEDLNNRCKHQEKDVHYYQNLLKEKDIILQERERNNEELESKLDLLWKNATKDS